MNTIKDVARVAGVSIATVSRCIHGQVEVSSETRMRVQAAMKELNFSPNLNASTLKRSSNDAISIVVTDIQNAFFSTIINRLEEDIEEHGYKLLATFVHNNPEMEKKYIGTLVSMRVKAILYTPMLNAASFYRNFQEQGIYGFQLYIRQDDATDSLVVNDEYGTYLAAHHLVERGHRRILLVDYGSENFMLRAKGYRRAFAESGLAPDEEGLMPLVPGSDLDAALRERLAKRRETAMIVVSDALALRALGQMQSLGLSYERDLSLVVYDEVKWASVLGITTIAHDVDAIARAISDQLSKRMKDDFVMKGEAVHLRIDPYLIERSSVRRLPSGETSPGGPS